MTSREDVARALAFFENCDDAMLLHRLIGEVALRAREMVGRHMQQGTEENLPGPADLRPARQPATESEALATLRSVSDFPLLQLLAQAIGRRIEAIEIVASAEFPSGARVVVPERVGFPPTGRTIAGTVEATGMSLRVILDNGETWEGPPSLARREGAR